MNLGGKHWIRRQVRRQCPIHKTCQREPRCFWWAFRGGPGPPVPPRWLRHCIRSKGAEVTGRQKTFSNGCSSLNASLSQVPTPRPRPRLEGSKIKTKTETLRFNFQDQDLWKRVSRGLETKTQVSRTPSLLHMVEAICCISNIYGLTVIFFLATSTLLQVPVPVQVLKVQVPVQVPVLCMQVQVPVPVLENCT